MTYLRLFYEFFKTGLFAVGGGLATLPFLNNMADSTGWFTRAQLADMVAVSESTPGPIGVNMATYVGFLTAGVPGALIATLGLVAPSIVVILLIASFLKRFQDNRYVKSAFDCLRPASTALIAASGIHMAISFFSKTGADQGAADTRTLILSMVLAAALLVLTRVIKKTRTWHPVVWIALSAAIGIAFSFAGA